MNLLLLATAISAGVAAFCIALALQRNVGSTRRAVKARMVEPRHEQVGGRSSGRIGRPLTSAMESLELELTQAGWPIRVGEFMLLRIVLAVVLGWVAFLYSDWLTSTLLLRLLLTAGAGWFGSWLPVAYLRRRRQARLKTVDDQLPDTLSGMAKALQAGAGLLQALDNAAVNTAAPLGPELQLTMRDLQLGGEPQAVFSDLVRRLPSHDLEIASTAIMIQRTVGGNLSEILEHVAATIRERHDLKREIEVITSTQMLTGNLVALLPVGIALLFYALNPDVARLLIEEPVGRIALAVGICFEVLGIWLIRRLSVVEM